MTGSKIRTRRNAKLITILGIACLLVAGAGCGMDEKGGKQYGETCDFVSGQTNSLAAIEYSNVSECESGYCMAFVMDRYCTAPCGSDQDCQAGSKCLPISTNGSFCMIVSNLGG